MTVAIVQTATPNAVSGSGGAAASFASAPTAGNKIVMVAAVQDSTTSNAPTPASGFVQSGEVVDGTRRAYAWHKEAGSGETTSVAYLNGPGGVTQFFAWEVSGLADTDLVIDLVGGVDGRSTGAFATSLYLSLSGDSPTADMFCVAVLSPGNTIASLSASNGFGGIVSVSDRGFAVTRVDSTVVTPSTTMSWSTARFAAGLLVSFRGAAGGPPPSGDGVPFDEVTSWDFDPPPSLPPAADGVPFDEVTSWDFEAGDPPPPSPPPPPPVDITPVVTPGAVWTWVIGPGASQASSRPLRELTEAKGRTLTWRVDGHAVAQFTIDGRSDEIDDLNPLETDLWVWRDGVLMFRGRIGPENDQIDQTRHLCQFTATDYRGMLKYRTVGIVPFTRTATAQATIAWDLVQLTQATTGGNWGVTRGLTPVGTLRDREYPPGKQILEALEQLANVDGGFEWEISPDLVLNIWTPTRGADNGVILDRGGLISALDRNLSPDDYGNHVIALGSDSTTPQQRSSATIATDPRGRWEVVQSYSTIERQATLNLRADWLLTEASALKAPLVATFTPRRWEGKDHLWIGDTARLQVSSGRLGAVDVRAAEVQVSCGDNGTETVRVGLLEV